MYVKQLLTSAMRGEGFSKVQQQIAYNDIFYNFNKFRTPSKKWMQRSSKDIFEKRIFKAVFCGFGFIICKTCFNDLKKFFQIFSIGINKLKKVLKKVVFSAENLCTHK
jgi:hypothetical protein